MKTYNWEGVNPDGYFLDKLEPIPSALPSGLTPSQLYVFMPPNLGRSEERFSRNAETDIVCRLLLEKKKKPQSHTLLVCYYLPRPQIACSSQHVHRFMPRLERSGL